MWVKVNGVWREVTSTLVKVNGIWRESNVYIKEEERLGWIQSSLYTPDQILGFRIDYRLAPMEDQYYPDLPHLEYRDDLPIQFFIGGENRFDTRIKGASIHYFSHKDYTEGISKWHGRLYILFNDGKEFLVDDPSYSEYLPICDIIVNWTAFVDWGDTDIRPYGWNSIFSERQIMDRAPFTVQELNEAIENGTWGVEPPRIILPIKDRSNDYRDHLEIGVARNTSKPEHNMLGSSGSINQVIKSISVNNVSKPFIITTE